MASARDCCVSANAPLCTIARWKSPREPRETRWASTDRPPADWPAMVTLLRVAAELLDVAPYPAQRRLLIHQAVVARRAARPRSERRVREEAERAQPVVDRDHDGALRRELGAVVVAGGILSEAASVDPDEHRATISAAAAQSRRGDVQVQAVLGDGAGRQEQVLERVRLLWAARRELGRVADTVPIGRRPRGAPPQLPGGGGGVGQPAEGVATGHGDAADGAALDGDDRGATGARGRGGDVGVGSGGAGPRDDQRGQSRAARRQQGTP